MESQINRLQRENAILRSRLEQHGISTEVSLGGDTPELADPQADSEEEDESDRVTGKHVV